MATTEQLPDSESTGAGLFDCMATLAPATSAEIASAAGLDERYVREWLGGMVCAAIIDHDSTTHTYHLPAHHAPALTRAGGPDNVAKMAQYIALLGEVEQRIVGCFRNGGGVSYSAFPRFHALRAEESGEVFDAALTGTILPLVNGLTERLKAGIEVADFGCGKGHAINVMAQAFPASRFTGYDFSEQTIAAARAEAVELGLTNANFYVRDLAVPDAPEAFDTIVVFDPMPRRRSTPSWCSTPSMTRSAPIRCWPISIVSCAPVVTCWWSTSRRHRSLPRTVGFHGLPGSTRYRRCTA